MKTPVNFELAKLLKEKGFICHNSDKFWNDGFSFDKKDYNPIAYKDKDNVGNIADVVMWLYEKQGIWIVVNVQIDDSWYFELYNLKDSRNAEIRVDIYDNIYENPTEAYQTAITYTLENII